MKRFYYADDQIGGKEFMIMMPSMVVGAGILDLPRHLAAVTVASDGWLSLLVSGGIATFLAWIATVLAARFKGQTFFTYSSAIVTKPVSIVFTIIFGIISILITSYVIRTLGLIAKRYLFERTPIEVIALTFFLVVIYAVAGSRAGLFRLNVLFFPIIAFIISLVLLFVIGYVDLSNLLPVFKTDFPGYLKGVEAGTLSYTGTYIALFYVAYVKRPKIAPKMAILGMCMPIVLYIFIYLFCIAVFGHSGTSDLQYPTIELAKRVEIPGGILERFESVFFVIWMMAIFNTAAMAFDVSVIAFHSIFKKAKKITIILILSPIVYYICMLPRNYIQLAKLGTFIGYGTGYYSLFTIFLLLIVAKIRGINRVK